MVAGDKRHYSKIFPASNFSIEDLISMTLEFWSAISKDHYMLRESYMQIDEFHWVKYWMTWDWWNNCITNKKNNKLRSLTSEITIIIYRLAINISGVVYFQDGLKLICILSIYWEEFNLVIHAIINNYLKCFNVV